MFLFIIMSKGADKDSRTWSTWEELLLAFAVKRHGLKDWDTVAMELQNRHRSTLPSPFFTAQICKDRYRYLKQRFTNHHRNNAAAAAAGGGGGVGRTDNNHLPSAVDSDADEGNNDVGGDDDTETLPLLEELRKIRVAELKREVQRYDLSIESLQMKVKTMEEEREKSLSENQKQPDLDEEIKERTENVKMDGSGDSPDEAAGKSVSNEDENRSFNESNSTDNRRGNSKTEPEREPAEVKPESDSKPVGEEDSCNDSSDRHELGKASRKRDSDELRDSVSDSKEGTKESSDVQSSASLMTRKRRRKGEVDGVGGGDGSGGATVVSPPILPIKREGGRPVKSEPLVGFLDRIRSHKHGSVFERRLESQKTDEYSSIIRRHVDLEAIQARIDNGSYSSCPTRFYVDLLLMFNNAIVFFPKSSPESLAAHELRQIVTKELKNNISLVLVEQHLRESSSPKVRPKPDPEKPDSSLLAQHKSTAPIIVCRKRSSIQAKASSSSVNNKVEKQAEDNKPPPPVPNSKPPPVRSPLSTSNEEESSMKQQLNKMKEKPVTGVRSMRRSSKGRPNNPSSNSRSTTPPSSSAQNQGGSSSQQNNTMDKGQQAAAAAAAKVEKKKAAEEAAAAATVLKKRGAADFLKRIKKNDPAKGTLVEALKSSGDGFKGGKREQPAKKLDEVKDGQVRRSGGGGGGGGGKQPPAKEESSPSKRSVGRPPKKGAAGKEAAVAVVSKRGRESGGGGEGEGSSKRAKKRSRR